MIEKKELEKRLEPRESLTNRPPKISGLFLCYNIGMNINKNNITGAYIDANYYTNIFKPNKNAMLIGRFNNVESHVADFDAFRNRASELVDRLLSNKISQAGGIDFISETPRTFLKKATAAVVQHWFINGYVVSDLDSTLSIGSFNIRQYKTNETFRKVIGLDALALIQKSGMWDNKIMGIDLSQELGNLGIDQNDILYTSDAIQLFQQKGDYDNNFHVDIDFTNELTGLNIDRWVKIVETTNKFISFDISGGSGIEVANAKIFMKDNGVTSSDGRAYTFSTELLTNTQKPDYYFQNVNGVLSIYVKVDDDLDPTLGHFLISNIYADDAGEYKLFGSQTNDTGLFEMGKFNVLQAADVTALEAEIKLIRADIAIAKGLEPLITQNVADVKVLKSDVSSNKVVVADVRPRVLANEASIQSNLTNLRAGQASIIKLEDESIKRDGSVQIDPSFTPSRGGDLVAFRDLTALEAKINSKTVAQTSGFETTWEGSEGQVVATDKKISTIDLIPLKPQLGTAFDFDNKKHITLTFESKSREETVITRIGNDDKWDDVLYIPFNTTDAAKPDEELNLMQIKIKTNGTLEIRYVMPSGVQIDINQTVELPDLVSIYQITGNVYSSTSSDVDPQTIEELESVVI